MKGERKKEEDKKMIGERADPKGSSAAIKEIANKYDSDDSTAKDKTEHKKEEMICAGPEAEVEKNPDETTREMKQVVGAIEEVVFQDLRKGNFDKLGNRSSNTLGMRVKDSFIIIVQQTQRKAVPFDGLRASQLAYQLHKINCEDGRIRFLPSPRIESPAPSSETESLSTRQKKSVSLAEHVKVLNHLLENEVFIESEAGIVIGEPRIDNRENAAESVDKICGSVDEKSPPDSIAESVSSVSVDNRAETLPFLQTDIAAEDVDKIGEETSGRDFRDENYLKYNLPKIRETETRKEIDFQMVERRFSLPSSSRYSKLTIGSVEMSQESLTASLNGADEDIPNLKTTSGDDAPLRLVNVEGETEVENLPVELSVTVNKSYPSSTSKIARSQENSMSKINENFTLQVRETELQLVKGGTPQIAGYTDRENLFSEMLESIGCIVENLDDDTELLTEQSDEGAAIGEESERANEYAREELTSDIEEEVQQLEPVIGEEKSENIDDVKKAENDLQEIFSRSVKCSENFKKEDSTFSLNAFIAMLDSASMSLKGDTEVRILETKVLTMDHIGNEESKNNDDNRGIALCSPDQLFTSKSSSSISHKINAEKLSEEFEIRFENSVESEHVDGGKSSNNKNAPNTTEEMELVEEDYVQDKKCGEKDSSEVIRAQEIQTSAFFLQCEKSLSTLHKRRKERTDSKSTGSWDKIKAEPVATGNANGEIRKRSRDKRTRESAKKFVNSLSQIFGKHSARKRNATKPSSSQMKPRKQLQVVETTLASSDDREIGKKSANVQVKDDGEELIAVESLNLTNNTKETTNHEFPAAAASKNVKKNFSSENQEANKLLVNSNVAEETKNIPEERLEKPSSRNNRLEKKQRKTSSGKSFAMIRKFFSKPLTKSKNETEHQIQKQLFSVKRAEEKTAEEGNGADRKQQTEPEATKQVSVDLKGQQNRREVPFVDTSGAGVVVNKVEPSCEQQVNCPESRKDKRYIWLLSGLRITNSRSIDHLERVEMRTSVEKNPPDELGADSTTPSIENVVKRMKGEGVNRTKSVFSRTIKRLFKQRGSAADSITSKWDTCSISSRNETLNTTVVTGTNKSRQGCRRDESFRNGGFVVFDEVVTDRRKNLFNREEICENFNNDHENCFTSEPKSMVSLLRTRMAKKSLDVLTEAFHKSSKRSATSSEDNIIESLSRIQNSTRNTFPTAFMTEHNPRGVTLTLTRDIESIPSGRRKTIVVMMATPDPPRKEVHPETSNTSNNQRGSSSSSPTAFYYLLGPTLDEALLDVRAVFQQLIDKIARRSINDTRQNGFIRN